jgi:NADPH:quinone reductase-like Zn-dependent oxidoreductase
MRAVVTTGHGGLDKLIYREDVPVPVPGPGQVLIEVGACGLNNTDLNTRTGWYASTVTSAMTEEIGAHGIASETLAAWSGQPIKFPIIQGADAVGRIVAVGPGVSSLRIGERVMVDPCVRDPKRPARARSCAYIGSEIGGGYAEYSAVPAGNAFRVTSGLGDAELATFACSYSTAEEMLTRVRLEAGETILVTGASGGVGSAHLQLAKLRGARIIAVANAAKEARIRALGADFFIARERRDLAGAVTELVGAQGVDVVADVVGGDQFIDMLRVLRRGGRYVSAGAIAGPVPAIDLRDLIYKDLEMHGVANPEEETFRRLVRYIEDGDVKPLLERTYPLSHLREAQADFMKKAHVGNLVIAVKAS